MSRRPPAKGGALATKRSLILKEPPKPSKRLAEVAGGKAAECAAVVCCCPCSLVNLLILTVVKLPAGLFRRAMRRRKMKRKRKKKAGLLGVNNKPKASVQEDKPASSPAPTEPPMPWPAKSPSAEVSEMEKKMWPEFFGTGFWRSPSQRELSVINNQ
ncbi:uncharacterized protein LOC110108221 [Dendrobium catenatum]|uniref:Uncharacterized protein n=1 Tax=Dendrobium catenatum TaxID=906689 RepID=A0A2I0VN27_9ASPA|nr:uncharacterized protein LOC110108221 [Dendrobium catenatum]PKU64800.1 hypothetical protein MA16_Dca012664 [Dendrobium catenatum]